MAIPACDGLEFDVRLSADGVPVLLHDPTLDRVQGRPEAGRRARARTTSPGSVSRPSRTSSRRVPRRAFLDIELKEDPGRALIEILAAGRGPEMPGAVVSSFDPATLERIGDLAPAWPRWLNTTI